MSGDPFDSKDFATLTGDLLAFLSSGEGGRVALTDDTEGSVVRTLAEAFARELAVCYQQLRKVYQDGFLDTAGGVALENVVGLLGIARQRAGHIEGSVTFWRRQAAPEDIPVPPGTRVAGRAAAGSEVPLFETTEQAFIPKGDTEISVPVRSLEPGSQVVAVGALTLMPRPLWGVEGVTNRADLLPRQKEESDPDLRERARGTVQSLNFGTLAAIEQAVRSLGIGQVTVREDPQLPGVVEVVLGDPDVADDLYDQAQKAVQQVRPAGIHVEVQRSERVVVQIAATLVLREDLPEERRKGIREQITQGMRGYFDTLKVGELVRVSKVASILSAPEEVALLEPPPDGFYLRPYLRVGKVDQDVANVLLAANGDVRLTENQRAALDPEGKPLLLNLEPPALDVWVDLVLEKPLTAQEEADLKTSLQAQLDTLKPVREVSYQELTANHRNIAVLNLIHQKDGLAVRLEKPGDVDQLKERERLRVGKLDVRRENG